MGVLNNIIAAVDGSAMAEEVLKRAIALAKKENAQITVLHCIDIPLFEKLFGDVYDEESVRKKIEEKMALLNGDAGADYFVTVTKGNPADAIVYEADRLKSGLIVIDFVERSVISKAPMRLPCTATERREKSF